MTQHEPSLEGNSQVLSMDITGNLKTFHSTVYYYRLLGVQLPVGYRSRIKLIRATDGTVFFLDRSLCVSLWFVAFPLENERLPKVCHAFLLFLTQLNINMKQP